MSCAVFLSITAAAIALVGVTLITYLALAAVCSTFDYRRERAVEVLQILLPQEIRLWRLRMTWHAPSGRRRTAGGRDNQKATDLPRS